jgi:WD40 repeat protein
MVAQGAWCVAQSPNGNEPDYYAVLAVVPTADEETIRQAYRKLARAYHPDVAGESGAEPMKRVNAAYRVLSDPDRRRAYDQRRVGAASSARSASPARPRTTTHPNAAPPPPAAPTRSAGPLHLHRAIDTGDQALTAAAFAQGDALLGLGFSDGRVEVWHLPGAQRVTHLQLPPGQRALRPGVLHDIRLAPSGMLAMAWGLNLGTHIWDCRTGQIVWSASFSAPSGATDGIVLDTPLLARLATPAAPLALAEEDPFQWAEAGRMGSDVWTRPLAGVVAPAWAVPLRCDEPTPPGRDARSWRVHRRALAWDGESLLTFSTGPASANISNASIVHLWNLRQRGRLGTAGPQLQGNIVIPARALWYPIAVSANATVFATQFEERAMRLYALHTGQFVEVPTGPVAPTARVALSADGALLALAPPDARRVDLWATASGQRVQTWDLPAPVAAITFAPTGGMPALAIARNDGRCEVWTTA